ncbi:hypothetical protein ETD83_16870 [Actinomadura soli]|uniref:Uncharacterized protein n=1 Tax=Actinomadura soli TaxID=2508997 RepID=A0A5C4JCG6_9ACTN|nr:hypothetical protein [Actinomadura soli]TMR00423.1 hypothetical protein ETD83_16870 [Actinomadura soli]
MIQGNWYTATVIGHHQEIKCPQGNCGLVIEYTDVKYVDHNGKTHKASIDQKYNTTTVRIFATPPSPNVITSLWVGYAIAFGWLLYAITYLYFIRIIIIGGRFPAVDLG